MSLGRRIIILEWQLRLQKEKRQIITTNKRIEGRYVGPPGSRGISKFIGIVVAAETGAKVKPGRLERS